ncbi:MAG: hypothetical protein MOGMAGMI_02495 [Candidatus Omnitrophica bacterium]|nr:hypothetical protein [Candidatus Omnitrophota bacterium]
MLTDTPALDRFIALAETPAAERVIKFPLTPSAFWDDNPTVVWSDVHPKSPFGRAAIALGLRHKVNVNGTLRVLTTQEELALLISWAWEN